MTICTGFKKGVNYFFEYNTPKIVHIKDKRIGIINRLIQTCIICYFIGYSIILKKGYQLQSDLESTIITKVKGIISTEDVTNFRPGIDTKLYKRIWDANDLIVPPLENDALFVTTNIIITPNQTLGTCDGDPSDKTYVCKNKPNDYCKDIETFDGLPTGNCNSGLCEIKGWCPVERDVLPLENDEPLFSQTKNFTLLIKNSIQFREYNVRRRNILTNNKTHLQTCINNEKTDPHCPIFVLDDIVKRAGEDYDEIAKQGAVIAIHIEWNCNLDYNENKCKPEYNFRRMDDPNAVVSNGLNYRYSNYFKDGSRTLYKAVGIRFIFLVDGRAGKFDFVPLVINIGSGLGLLAIATIICDIIAFYIIDKEDYYQNQKIQLVPPRNENFQNIEEASTSRRYSQSNESFH